MDLTITKQTENPLLSRKEVEAKIIFEGATPKRSDVQKDLAKAVKAAEKMVIVQTIQTVFGQTQAQVVAHVYSDENAMKANERANLLEKHTGHGAEPEQPAQEEAPAAEESADAPAEENTEAQ
ncbi:MAG: hypothetical protein KDK61_08815 [Simkania sp.]|nr:hypothetical protein [Nanoarchaeota archaeon]MCB1084398.1 hypothetical protein [Simkania sp.]